MCISKLASMRYHGSSFTLVCRFNFEACYQNKVANTVAAARDITSELADFVVAAAAAGNLVPIL